MSAEVIRSQLCGRQVSVPKDISTGKRYVIPSLITDEQMFPNSRFLENPVGSPESTLSLEFKE